MIKEKEIIANFEVDETFENNNWLKVKIRTFAFGENANGSDILPSTFSDFGNAKNTIGGIPIVARYNLETDNLEGHNVSLKKDSNGELQYYYGTDPIGFTSPTATFYFDEVYEGETVNTYVTIDDIYLWKRYEATSKILEWFSEGVNPKVSMEISNVVGNFNESGFYEISDFEFSAICALGSDVQPCFKMAEIQTYSNSEFNNDFKLLMEELKFSLTNTEKGGKSIVEDNIIEEVTVEEVVETEFTEEIKVEETTEEVVETEFTEEVVEEELVAETEFTEEVKSEETIEIMYALTHNQLRDELSNELGKLKFVDKWDDERRKYWLVDVTDTTVIVEDVSNNWLLASMSYSTSGDTVSIDESTYTRVKVAYVPLEGSSEQFTLTSERFEAEKSELVEQLNTLKAFERTTLENELSAKFEEQLTEDEIKNVFSNVELSIDELEKELFSLVGKKNFSTKKVEVKHNKVSVDLGDEQSEPKYNPYKEFFAKSKK